MIKANTKLGSIRPYLSVPWHKTPKGYAARFTDGRGEHSLCLFRQSYGYNASIHSPCGAVSYAAPYLTGLSYEEALAWVNAWIADILKQWEDIYSRPQTVAPTRKRSHNGKWSDPSVPRSRWEYVGGYDLGTQALRCGMCEEQLVRYVQHMVHPDYPDLLAVCSVCAGYMEGDSLAAQVRDELIRGTSLGDKKRVASRVWMERIPGIVSMDVEGFTAVVQPSLGGWIANIRLPDGNVKPGTLVHETADLAKAAVLRHLMSKLNLAVESESSEEVELRPVLVNPVRNKLSVGPPLERKPPQSAVVLSYKEPVYHEDDTGAETPVYISRCIRCDETIYGETIETLCDYCQHVVEKAVNA